jgi:hypothetical protein
VLQLSSLRFIVEDGELWDGCACLGEFIPLSVTDSDVRRDINALLVNHQQRDLPPEKPKAKPRKKKETTNGKD